MKYLYSLAAFLPTGALAHGAHPPVADSAHSVAHLAVGLGLSVAAIVVGFVITRDDREKKDE